MECHAFEFSAFANCPVEVIDNPVLRPAFVAFHPDDKDALGAVPDRILDT